MASLLLPSILYLLPFLSSIAFASPPSPTQSPTLSLPPLPLPNTTLSARNSECFTTHSFPFPHPSYVNPRACDPIIRLLQTLRPTIRTFGSSTQTLIDLDDTGPWVWPSFSPGARCYVSLHSVELGDTISLKISEIAWKAILILRDCDRGLYGGRKWIGNNGERVPGRFYVRVAGAPPGDEPE